MNFVFSNPGILWGLVGVALPIAIHLLMRRKPVVEYWGATRFLKRVIEKNKAQIQVHSYSHLLLRMLILALLVLAAANPRSDSSMAFTDANKNVHRLLIVDMTMSMGATENGDSRFDEVLRQVSALVGQSSPGDSWQLLLHGTEDSPVRFRIPVYEPKLILNEIAQLSPGMQSDDLTETIQRATTLVDEFPGTNNEIFFWTDLVARDWNYEGSEEYELNARFERLSQVAKVSLIDVAERSLPNVAVTNFRTKEKQTYVGETVDLEATVKNFSVSEKSVTVELRVGDERITEKKVALASNETESVEFQTLLTRSGIVECEVLIGQDALTADNSRNLAFEVQGTTEVLIIEEAAPPDSLKQSDFLTLALSPASRHHDSGLGIISPRYSVSTVTPTLFLSQSMQDVDVLIVCGLKEVSAIIAQRFSDFVQRGGGILFTMSDEISLADYNNLLGENGKDLFPVRLKNKRSIDADATPFRIGPFAEKHPILKPFQLHPSAGLQTTRIYSYVDSEADSQSTDEVILSLEDGAPLLVVSQQGLGEVSLVTTAFNTRWGSWVLWPSFLPMVQRLIDDLAVRDTLILNSVIGKKIPNEMIGLNNFSTIETSNGEVLLEVTRFDEKFNETFDLILDKPDIYRLKSEDRKSPVQLIARHVDTTESDLRHINSSKLQSSALLKGLDISIFNEASRLAFQRRGIQSGEDAHLSRWLLFATILLAFLDQLYLIHPHAVLGALLGGGLSGMLTIGTNYSPAIKVALVLVCVLGSAYLAKQLSAKFISNKRMMN